MRESAAGSPDRCHYALPVKEPYAGVRVESVDTSSLVLYVWGQVDLLTGPAVREAILDQVRREPSGLLPGRAKRGICRTG